MNKVSGLIYFFFLMLLFCEYFKIFYGSFCAAIGAVWSKEKQVYV